MDASKIVKAYHEASEIVILRTPVYTDWLADLLQLFEMAKADFPGLEASEVEVRKYIGHEAGRGLEFKRPAGKVSDKYHRISSMPMTR